MQTHTHTHRNFRRSFHVYKNKRKSQCLCVWTCVCACVMSCAVYCVRIILLSYFMNHPCWPLFWGLGLMAFQTCCRWISDKCDILAHKWAMRVRWRELTCHLLGMHCVVPLCCGPSFAAVGGCDDDDYDDDDMNVSCFCLLLFFSPSPHSILSISYTSFCLPCTDTHSLIHSSLFHSIPSQARPGQAMPFQVHTYMI